MLFQICQYARIGQVDSLRVLPIPARYLNEAFQNALRFGFDRQFAPRVETAWTEIDRSDYGSLDPDLLTRLWLIQIAYNQNLTLESAGTQVLQARAVLGIAIGITYPQVQQGVGSVIYNRTSAATPLAGPNATPHTSGPMLLLRRRPGSWTSGASFAAELNPPMACTWRRLRLMTAFWCRFWPMLPQLISVSAQ